MALTLYIYTSNEFFGTPLKSQTPRCIRPHHSPKRAGYVPTDFLGLDYRGIIETDGYQGYDQFGQQPGIIHAGCLAHARRKFVEVEKASGPNANGGMAHQVIKLIRLVYAVESLADARSLDVEPRRLFGRKGPSRSWRALRNCSLGL